MHQYLPGSNHHHTEYNDDDSLSPEDVPLPPVSPSAELLAASMPGGYNDYDEDEHLEGATEMENPSSPELISPLLKLVVGHGPRKLRKFSNLYAIQEVPSPASESAPALNEHDDVSLISDDSDAVSDCGLSETDDYDDDGGEVSPTESGSVVSLARTTETTSGIVGDLGKRASGVDSFEEEWVDRKTVASVVESQSYDPTGGSSRQSWGAHWMEADLTKAHAPDDDKCLQIDHTDVQEWEHRGYYANMEGLQISHASQHEKEEEQVSMAANTPWFDDGQFFDTPAMPSPDLTKLAYVVDPIYAFGSGSGLDERASFDKISPFSPAERGPGLGPHIQQGEHNPSEFVHGEEDLDVFASQTISRNRRDLSESIAVHTVQPRPDRSTEGPPTPHGTLFNNAASRENGTVKSTGRYPEKITGFGGPETTAFSCRAVTLTPESQMNQPTESETYHDRQSPLLLSRHTAISDVSPPRVAHNPSLPARSDATRARGSDLSMEQNSESGHAEVFFQSLSDISSVSRADQVPNHRHHQISGPDRPPVDSRTDLGQPLTSRNDTHDTTKKMSNGLPSGHQASRRIHPQTMLPRSQETEYQLEGVGPPDIDTFAVGSRTGIRARGSLSILVSRPNLPRELRCGCLTLMNVSPIRSIRWISTGGAHCVRLIRAVANEGKNCLVHSSRSCLQ